MEWPAYKAEIKASLERFEFDAEIPSILRAAAAERRQIFIAGNGGSAAIASHYVCDLSKGANKDWRENRNRFRVVCLNSNMSYITAISNDEHYEQVFTQQLINLANRGDILILISSSGNSPNVVHAAEWAKKHGLVVIGVCGFDGGRLKGLANHYAHIPHEMYEVCEDIHHIFGHFLVTCLRDGMPAASREQ